MSYDAKILADSVAPCDKRLTTYELTYPRFVHAELMTHRMFSRNSASSRAIPSAKLIERVRHDPVMPLWWGKNQAGMAAHEELTGDELQAVQHGWLVARDNAVRVALGLAEIGLHKQLANRLVEPWMFITVIVSATEYDNFFRLRCHPAAQPEIRWVAEAMRALREASQPAEVMGGGIHAPLWGLEGDVADVQRRGLDSTRIKKLATARCARVSYLTHDGQREPEQDIALHDKLAESGHWSPFEHVATALDNPVRIGNFIGWRQYRAEVDPHYQE